MFAKSPILPVISSAAKDSGFGSQTRHAVVSLFEIDIR